MKQLTLFEPLFQELRIRKVLSHIPKNSMLIDVGCDQPQVLIDRVCDDVESCIGVDIVVKEHKHGNVKIFQQDLQKKIKLPSSSATVITMLAVLEHMKYPKEMIQECFRILKPGGSLLVTVPSPSSKPLLEVFAVLGLVRKEMIEQHENYFTSKRLTMLAKEVGFSDVRVELFEFGFNTFMRAVK